MRVKSGERRSSGSEEVPTQHASDWEAFTIAGHGERDSAHTVEAQKKHRNSN